VPTAVFGRGHSAGHDAAHATSAVRYREECLPRSHSRDRPVDG